MYCIFCGSINIILKNSSVSDVFNDYTRLINGGEYYCNHCRNEFVVKYDPLRVLYND
jgi:hypothetical protein